MSKPIIYWYPNSNPCRGTWLSVQNLGIDVDFRVIKLNEKEQLKPEFLKINPMHCVPTLDDNGYVIWESRAISTYLADAKAPGTTMYPSDPKIRGLIDSRLYFDATIMNTRVRAIVRPIVYQGETTIGQDKIESVKEAYDYLEGFLTKTGYMASDSVTIADCHLLACVTTTFMLGIGFESHPKLREWYEKCRKSVKGFDEHEEIVRKLTDMVKSKLK